MQTAKATKCFCNTLAIQKGLDPVGSAHDFKDAVIIETVLPWTNNIYSEAGALPQEMIDLLALWLQRYRDGLGYSHRPLMIAPDAEYSRPGYRRVMYYDRESGAIAQFRKVEYLVPDELAGKLLWALFEARDDLPRFEPYRDSAHDTTRDLLVCTHGTVDAACAKFGYPLYNDLRRNYDDDHLRTWRVSHFGGHVYAPTMMEMPSGHYWAYVQAPQSEQIARRNGDVRHLYGNYRGWAGVEDGFLQAAERELWMRYGWAWFAMPRSGRVLMQEPDVEEPTWADVEIRYILGGREEIYMARVEIERYISTPYSTASPEEHTYPQYIVTAVEPA